MLCYCFGFGFNFGSLDPAKFAYLFDAVDYLRGKKNDIRSGLRHLKLQSPLAFSK